MRISDRQQLKIIRAIVAARKEARIPGRELAERLGAYASLIHKIESGDRDITVGEFIAIAKAMDVDPVELLRKAVI